MFSGRYEPNRIVILPAESSTEGSDDNTINATRNEVALTGVAKQLSFGPKIGKRDIGELEDSYYFCVLLPGVSSDPSKFHKCLRSIILLVIAVLV